MTAEHDLRRHESARTQIDRAGAERSIPNLLENARSDASTRVLVVHGDAAPLASANALHFVRPGDVVDAAEWAFLGRTSDGTAVLAAFLAADAEVPFGAPAGWGSLRVVGGELGEADAESFVAALSLGRWLRGAPFCPACGARTEVRNAGWSRVCPECGREHFPRTDPAVIVTIGSATDPDRLLLGSNALWGADRYSCFAGFVEAGETLEAAVAREVEEESGIRVASVQYFSSQAWPYPRSLMLGFHAIAADDDTARADGEEIAQVRWFDRSEIAAAFAGKSDIVLPGTASIAHRLIADWLAS